MPQEDKAASKRSDAWLTPFVQAVKKVIDNPALLVPEPAPASRPGSREALRPASRGHTPPAMPSIPEPGAVPAEALSTIKAWPGTPEVLSRGSQGRGTLPSGKATGPAGPGALQGRRGSIAKSMGAAGRQTSMGTSRVDAPGPQQPQQQQQRRSILTGSSGPAGPTQPTAAGNPLAAAATVLGASGGSQPISTTPTQGASGAAAALAQEGPGAAGQVFAAAKLTVM